MRYSCFNAPRFLAASLALLCITARCNQISVSARHTASWLTCTRDRVSRRGSKFYMPRYATEQPLFAVSAPSVSIQTLTNNVLDADNNKDSTLAVTLPVDDDVAQVAEASVISSTRTHPARRASARQMAVEQPEIIADSMATSPPIIAPPIIAPPIIAPPIIAPPPSPEVTPTPDFAHNFRGRLLDTPRRRMPMLSAPPDTPAFLARTRSTGMRARLFFCSLFFSHSAGPPCAAGRDISTYLDPCVAPPYIGLDCFIIREPFYLAFIAATCVDNVAQMTLATTQTCFMLDTGGNGVGYGQWVHYYSSAQGCEWPDPTAARRVHVICPSTFHSPPAS